MLSGKPKKSQIIPASLVFLLGQSSLTGYEDEFLTLFFSFSPRRSFSVLTVEACGDSFSSSLGGTASSCRSENFLEQLGMCLTSRGVLHNFKFGSVSMNLMRLDFYSQPKSYPGG